ncbi:MAG: tyrosine-type recombinase/integrase [Planctomycetaceae bacterium]|nr:tyrosine-type recombinase/integrase [Planctomycetaceae bacterium]
MASYIDGRTDLASRTVLNLRQAERRLAAYFGPDKLLVDLTPADAEGFVVHLRANLSPATVRRECGRAKQFLNAAVNAKLLAENAFKRLVSGDYLNRERQHYWTAAEAAAVLEHCPDAQWRLIIGLAYYAGLRCPSEVLGVRWADVNWATKQLRVKAEKTKRHSGGGVRDVPICPELYSLLLDVFAQAEAGAEFVVTRYRSDVANMRTQFGRIVQRAGLKPIPKPFVNMRATCETNWLRLGVPEYQVSSWIGHRVEVSRRHYDLVLREYSELVTGGAANSGAIGDESALRKAVPPGASMSSTESHGVRKGLETSGFCECVPNEAGQCVNTGPQSHTPKGSRTPVSRMRT